MAGGPLARIETAGPGAKARRLVFDDDLEARLTSAAAAKALGLEAGCAGRETVEHALAEVELPLARERALQLLGYREHSAAELRGKLRDNGYPAPVADAVVRRFLEVELVDDRRFASAWTRSRIAAGYGPRRIRQELSQRGIDADLIDVALAEGFGPRDEIERARRALGGRTAADRAGRDKLVRRLVSRGFSLSVSLEAVQGDPELAE